jgi:predicted ribosome quality control (RQC) complex YloA/Tae2 family protein
MLRKLSSYDIHIIVFEMQDIIGSPIDKVYQLSHNEILIKYRNIKKNTKEAIFIRNGHFLCITKESLKTPTKPSSFAMALRKYIKNGRILEIYQHEFDRIVVLKIGKKDGVYSVVIEFFSEGNIILVDPKGNIIIPFIHQLWAHRKVKGRQPYMPPPSQTNPNILSFEMFEDLLKQSNADVVRTLAVTINLSGVIAEEICNLATINKEKKIIDLTQAEIKTLYDTLQEFITSFKSNNYKPVFAKRKDNIIDILPFKFKSYQQVDFEDTSSFVRGLSTFIEGFEKTEVKKVSESKTEKEIGKLYRMLEQQQNMISLLEKDIDRKKLEGELIYLHYKKIDQLLQHIQKIIILKDKKIEINKINELDFVKTFYPEQNTLLIVLNDTRDTPYELSLDFRKSVSENAEKAYNLSKKYLSKLHGAKKSVVKTLEKIKIMEKNHEGEKEKLLEEGKKIIQKQKTLWFERYRWSITSKGNLIVAGKDVKSNEQVVKKYLEKKDRYVHADIHGAPSCILKSKTFDDKTLDIADESLEEACMFAACYSKAWKQFTEAQAYWVLPEQVSKTAQSGEFVPKGAFIIRGKRNYCKCTLQLGIGLIDLDGKKMWMGGSVESIKTWCDTYIIMKPGNKSKKDISHLLSKVTKTPIDDIVSILPAGGAIIQESKGISFNEGGNK